MENLDAKIEEIHAASETASNLTLPDPARFYDDLADEYISAHDVIIETLTATEQFLDSLLQPLTKKKERAFESVPLNATVQRIDNGIVDALNEVIQKHDRACDEFQTRTENAREQLEADIVANALDQFTSRTRHRGAIGRGTRC